LLRTEKLVSLQGEAACTERLDMMRVYINDAADRINIAGKNAINSYTSAMSNE